MNNMEIIRIVNEAIPLDPKCKIESKQRILKRVWLLEKIKGLIQKELSQQFNAKQVEC